MPLLDCPPFFCLFFFLIADLDGDHESNLTRSKKGVVAAAVAPAAVVAAAASAAHQQQEQKEEVGGGGGGGGGAVASAEPLPVAAADAASAVATAEGGGARERRCIVGGGIVGSGTDIVSFGYMFRELGLSTTAQVDEFLSEEHNNELVVQGEMAVMAEMAANEKE